MSPLYSVHSVHCTHCKMYTLLTTYTVHTLYPLAPLSTNLAPLRSVATLNTMYTAGCTHTVPVYTVNTLYMVPLRSVVASSWNLTTSTLYTVHFIHCALFTLFTHSTWLRCAPWPRHGTSIQCTLCTLFTELSVHCRLYTHCTFCTLFSVRTLSGSATFLGLVMELDHLYTVHYVQCTLCTLYTFHSLYLAPLRFVASSWNFTSVHCTLYTPCSL